jgi:hypothetical protein
MVRHNSESTLRDLRCQPRRRGNSPYTTIQPVTLHSHILVIIEPFLVVGLIASIRRILVISLEAAALTKGGTLTAEGESIFRTSMIELALLGLLILILVVCITLLRRYAPTEGTPELQ